VKLKQTKARVKAKQVGLAGGGNRPASSLEAVTEGVVDCSVCRGDFDLDSEGGISGYLGILPVYFCPTCLSGITDLVNQLNGFEQ
jgi:hypothetical protein